MFELKIDKGDAKNLVEFIKMYFFQNIRDDKNMDNIEANVIYQEYISTSAIYNVISQMKKKGTSLKDAQLTALRYQVGGGFEIR